MSSHAVGNLVTTVLVAIFIINAIRRRVMRPVVQAAAERIAARAPIAPPPAPVRRRLAAAPSAPIAPTMGDTLPAEAAAAFPALDLSLPDTPGVPSAQKRRRIRTLGGGAAIGSPGWGQNAVLAMEILGPPVSLRSGATLGAPHAF